MRAQRILICCHDFSRGGTERIAIGLAKRWVEAGREVRFLCGTREGGMVESLDPRVAVSELEPPIRRSLFSRFHLGSAMAKELDRHAPDVIFLPGNFHLQLCIPLAKGRDAAGLAAPILFKMSNPLTPHGAAAPLLRAVIRRFSHCIDGVAAMNSGLGRELRAVVPHADIRTLYDPIYIDHGAAAAHHAAVDGRFHVVWAGRFEPQKDVTLALRVAAALKERLPLRLTLLGTGSQQALVEKTIAKLGLADVVETPGHVPSIDPWLRSADALLVTSRYEGGPAVAVEALAHGVPVVSTDCSHFLRDIMTLPQAGRIVPSREPEALASALLDLRAASAADPQALADLLTHLEPDICADAYLAWFDEVAAARG